MGTNTYFLYPYSGFIFLQRFAYWTTRSITHTPLPSVSATFPFHFRLDSSPNPVPISQQTIDLCRSAFPINLFQSRDHTLHFYGGGYMLSRRFH